MDFQGSLLPGISSLGFVSKNCGDAVCILSVDVMLTPSGSRLQALILAYGALLPMPRAQCSRGRGRAGGAAKRKRRALQPAGESDDSGPWRAQCGPCEQHGPSCRSDCSDGGSDASGLWPGGARSPRGPWPASGCHSASSGADSDSSDGDPWVKLRGAKRPSRKIDFTATADSGVLGSKDGPGFLTHPQLRKRYTGKGCCQCKLLATPCHEGVHFAHLNSLHVLFSSMTPDEFGMIIFTHYQMATGGKAESHDSGDLGLEAEVPIAEGQEGLRVKWHIGGHRVCFSNFCHLLGYSPKTIRRHFHNPTPPAATAVKQGRPQHQRWVVDYWFKEAYNSYAEPMPETPVRNTVAQRAADATHDVTFEGMPWLNYGEPLSAEEPGEDWSLEQPIVDIQTLLTVAATGEPVGLPIRYLPHQTVWEMYWLFRASWQIVHDDNDQRRFQVPGSNTDVCPSYELFNKRYKEVWRRYLKPRKVSQHAQCDTCFRCQETMRKSKVLKDRLAAARALRQHYCDQYLDRCIYWSLREYSSKPLSDVVCIIIDSMDKTKFAWPRYPFGVQPHAVSCLIRPKLVLTAALAHGWVANLFMCHEQLNHGADHWCEVLSRTLQDAWGNSCHNARVKIWFSSGFQVILGSP